MDPPRSRVPTLNPRDWVNFALVRCPDCFSVQVASCTRQPTVGADGPGREGAPQEEVKSAKSAYDADQESQHQLAGEGKLASKESERETRHPASASASASSSASASEAALTSARGAFRPAVGVGADGDGKENDVDMRDNPEPGTALSSSARPIPGVECCQPSLHCVPVLKQSAPATSGTLSVNLQCHIAGCNCAATDHARRGLDPLRRSTAAGHTLLPKPYAYCLTCTSALSKAEIAARPPFAWSRTRPAEPKQRHFARALRSSAHGPTGMVGGADTPVSYGKARNGSSATLNVEAFRVTVQEVMYLVNAWDEAALPDTITHSMIYCPCCRAVGFPGSEDHLTVFEGHANSRELVYTNPSAAAVGKVGAVDHWSLEHTPHCTVAAGLRGLRSGSRSSYSLMHGRAREMSIMELSRMRFDEDGELTWERDGNFAGAGADEWGSYSPGSDARGTCAATSADRRNRTSIQGGRPCLLPIRLSRSEAIRFRNLVEFHAVSVSHAVRIAPRKSAARYDRRQQLVCAMWNGGLKRLELARGEAELIAAFGDLRRLVVAEGAQHFLQHRDMMMLVEAARRIRDRDRVGCSDAVVAVGSGEQKTPNAQGSCGGEGEAKTNSSSAAPCKQKGVEYTMAVASALGWLLRAIKDDRAQSSRRGKQLLGYYAAGSLVSSPSPPRQTSPSALPSASRSYPTPPLPAFSASSANAPPSSALVSSGFIPPPPPPLPRGHPDEIRRLRDIHQHTRMLSNLVSARRRFQLQHQLEQPNWH